MVKPESLSRCFSEWVRSVIPANQTGLTVTFDGKTICSTTKMARYKNPFHIISAQLSERGITYALKTVAGKRNEIPTVPKLLQQFNVGGCLVLADAMLCQKTVARLIVQSILFAECKRKPAYFENGYRKCRELEPDELLRHARLEWTVETMHWLLDVHFQEDFFRAFDKNVQQNMNILRKLALNVMRTYQAKSVSKKPLSYPVSCIVRSLLLADYYGFF